MYGDNNYGLKTIRQIIDYVNFRKDKFPKGLDTPIVTGDFECNYTHANHEIQNYDCKFGNVICLSYEMHENEAGC